MPERLVPFGLLLLPAACGSGGDSSAPAPRSATANPVAPVTPSMPTSAAIQTIGPPIDPKVDVAQVLILKAGSISASATAACALLTQASKAQKLLNGNQGFLVPSLALAAHTGCPVNLGGNIDDKAFWPQLHHVNWSATLAHTLSP